MTICHDILPSILKISNFSVLSILTFVIVLNNGIAKYGIQMGTRKLFQILLNNCEKFSKQL